MSMPIQQLMGSKWSVFNCLYFPRTKKPEPPKVQEKSHYPSVPDKILQCFNNITKLSEFKKTFQNFFNSLFYLNLSAIFQHCNSVSLGFLCALSLFRLHFLCPSQEIILPHMMTDLILIEVRKWVVYLSDESLQRNFQLQRKVQQDLPCYYPQHYW